MQLNRLRQHPFLSAALALPLLVLAYYLAAHWLASRFMPPPQYDMLYMTNYSAGAANALHVEIKDYKLHIYYQGDNYGYGWARLWRFDPASGRYREIDIKKHSRIPLRTHKRRGFFEKDANRKHPIFVPEVSNARITSEVIAPDGYYFERLIEGREDFYQMFTNDRTPLLGYVTKAGKHIPLRAPRGPRTKDNVTFVGWILS